MQWILLTIFIIVIFVIAMLVITPYENEKNGEIIIKVCFVLFNFLYGAVIIPIILFMLNPIFKQNQDMIKYISSANFLVTLLVFMLSFRLLNKLFENQIKMDVKEYKKWRIGLVIGGFLLIMVL